MPALPEDGREMGNSGVFWALAIQQVPITIPYLYSGHNFRAKPWSLELVSGLKKISILSPTM